MNDRLSILFFTNSTLWGGVEGHICGLLGNLSRDVFQPQLVCDPAIYRHFRTELPRDVEVTPIELSHPTHIAGATKLARLLRRGHFQILHSHMFWSSLFSSPLARLCGVPVVVETLHGTEAWRQGWKANTLIDRAMTSFISEHVAVCESDKRFLIQKKHVPAGKIAVIHNGIETQRFGNRQASRADLRNDFGFVESDVVLIAVARLHPGKGHRVLLGAMRRLTQFHHNLKLVCLGEGEEEAELRNLCENLGLCHCVKWMGYQRNISEWLAAADINVLPTYYEGLPLTVLEAMASGLPTVASKVGGIPDALEDGVSGVLVPPGEPAHLVSALSMLINDAQTRRQIGAAARARVTSHFDLRQQVRKTEKMYLDLCRVLEARSNHQQSPLLASQSDKAVLPTSID